MPITHHELEFLLSFDGVAFQFGTGDVVKIEARRVVATQTRPRGVKYSLTLHDPTGRLISLSMVLTMPMRPDAGPNMTIATCATAGKSGATSIAVRRSCLEISTPRSGGY